MTACELMHPPHRGGFRISSRGADESLGFPFSSDFPFNEREIFINRTICKAPTSDVLIKFNTFEGPEVSFGVLREQL